MIRPVALLLAGLLGLAACSPSRAGDSDAQAVATVYPLAWIVSQVAPDLAVTSLTARGQEPHDLELSLSQRATVERATLVVYLGDIGFQPQVESAVESSAGQVVNAAEVVGDDRLLRIPGSDQVDPHLWFDAGALADVAAAVGDAAAKARPDQAAEYRANAARVVTQLRALAVEVDELLSRCRHDQVIVGHEAFAYLLEPHGLQQKGISGAGGADTQASPSDIADLAAEIRSENLPAILSTAVEGRPDADAVAREAGVDVVEVSSLDVVTPEQAAKGFPALLRDHAQAVATAAQCGASGA